MSRLPIRVRLTLAFALAMAAVLAATGAFLYLRLGSSLDDSIDERLQARAGELGAVVARGSTDVTDGADSDERFFQVLDAGGRVVASSRVIGGRPLLEGEAFDRAASGERRWFTVDDVRGLPGRARMLATRRDSSGGRRVLLVGESLEDRDETVRAFLIELSLVGPAALLLVSLLGYGLATAALRPVESMRREADAISASEPGRRLPLPASRDEVRRLGETLNEMLERLEVALERERAFVADASHELRTPLALLKTELELALRRSRSQEELERALRSAAEEADRLTRLADDLLLLARVDRGKLPLRRESVVAGGLLARIAQRFADRARAAERKITVEAQDSLALTGDPLRLEQAIENLVENALRHGSGTIRLSAAARDGQAELHVRDEGGGFPAEFLPNAFDRFSRADEARSGDGAGLGLTIAAAIATAHGGSIHAANRDRGADVWLSLPVR
jgi:two-component system, OmpR family, sensor kinase